LPKALCLEDLTISTILPQNCYNVVRPDKIIKLQAEVFGHFGGSAIFAISSDGLIANTNVKVGH
jgi:hypothetical protein